jgi:MFS family permease
MGVIVMLRNRYVRTILLSRVLLHLGIWIRNFAVLLYVTHLTDNDPIYVSLISVAEFAPIFLFAIIGGIFADRWRPKRTMAWSDALSALSVAAVWISVENGIWLALLAGAFVSASLSQFSQPSAMKLFKQHVPGEQLQKVMAMFQTLVGIFTVLGPVVGAFIYLEYGMRVSLMATVLLFAGSALVLSRLPKDEAAPSGGSTTGFLNEMRKGFRYISANRSLGTLARTFAVSGLAVGLIQPMLIFVTTEKLGQPNDFLQWLIMASGASMLIGGAAIMGIAKRMEPGRMLAIGLVVSAVSTTGLGLSSVIWVTILLQIAGGLFYPFIQVGIQTLMIKNTEAEFMGRVAGAITPMFMGMNVLGMSLGGLLKEAWTLTAVYSISGALLVVGALLLGPILGGGTAETAARQSLNR